MNAQKLILEYVGVRGLPERDISSLGVMGWGAGGGRKFFRRRPIGSVLLYMKEPNRAPALASADAVGTVGDAPGSSGLQLRGSEQGFGLIYFTIRWQKCTRVENETPSERQNWSSMGLP